MFRFLILTLVILAMACWPTQATGQQCKVSCPGQWGLPGHTPGSETDWFVPVAEGVLLWFGEYIPDPGPGYICVCEDECPQFPFDSPVAPEHFRWRGSVLSYPGDPRVWGYGNDWPVIEQTVTSVDLNCDCEVGLADFVIFANAWNVLPLLQPDYGRYVSFSTCEPVPPAEVGLADLVIFARHFGHACIPPGGCDP